MITARKTSAGINLLPQEEFASSTLGRILKWLLSTFRVIVIITQVIVMAAFLSRFWLDAKSNDLNNLIRKNQAILATTTDFENEFRNIQKKLEVFEKVSNLKANPSFYVERLTKNLPLDVYLSSIQITENSIQVKGESVSEYSIAQFMVNLKNDDAFSDVVLTGTNISQQNKSLIVFNLKIEMDKGGGK